MADAAQGLKDQGQRLMEASERCAGAATVLQEAYRAGVEELKSAVQVGVEEGMAAQRRFVQEELQNLLLKLQEQNRPWWRRRG